MDWNELNGLQLSDTSFNCCGSIDILLDIFSYVGFRQEYEEILGIWRSRNNKFLYLRRTMWEAFCKECSKSIRSLPFSNDLVGLGSNLTSGTAQLIVMERKFSQNNEFKDLYKTFMNDYISIGHMVQFEPLYNNSIYCMPHYGMTKEWFYCESKKK